jgi:hypothetical protein
MARPTVGILCVAGLALVLAGCPSKDEECASGQTLCNTVCLETASFQTDPNNCGGCGIACGPGATCASGVCQCPVGATRCDALLPRCRDLQTDPGACGACNTPCTKVGAGCAAGVCQCLPPRDDDCGTFCTDTLTDRLNCGPNAGSCGNACTLANEICAGGACTCPASFPIACPVDAPTACVNTQTDAANCGGCGVECPLTNDVCDAGTCDCPVGLPDICGSTCVDLDTDEQNCGTCGTVCPSGATCTGGRPAACQCPVGAPDVCNATCVDLDTDEQNCGACGTICATGAACTAGDCECPRGPILGCSGSCCGGGAQCCPSGGCPLAHANGLGGSYYDCGALDEHTLAQARLAAESWSATGITLESGLQCGSCLCRQTATQAAVWCYAGSPNKGLVQVTNSPNCLAAACPFAGYGVAWH